PLVAVVHAAGTLEDTLLEALQAVQVDRVFAPKVDGALALGELTADLDLAAFVLVSSAVGTIGGAGQANYAAANAALDAVAARRRSRGLPPQSLAFGLW
ncbi:MAG: KR domain-containing protein, partial [Solirubrobacteraceae bacterium]